MESAAGWLQKLELILDLETYCRVWSCDSTSVRWLCCSIVYRPFAENASLSCLILSVWLSRVQVPSSLPNLSSQCQPSRGNMTFPPYPPPSTADHSGKQLCLVSCNDLMKPAVWALLPLRRCAPHSSIPYSFNEHS